MADKTKVFLANVMDAYVYNSVGDLLFTSKALTDSSISIGLTAEEIRGGKGNKLIGRFFHDSTFGLELQDALFNLQYIALNVGADVVDGESGTLAEEQIVATDAGALTVSGIPAKFLDLGNIGWVALPGSDSWNKFEFADGSASATDVTLADGSALVAGDTYCVKYMNEVACEEITIPGDFIPSEVSVILKGNLYKAGKGNDVSTSSVVGHIEVEVPRLQMNGSMDITLNSSGASQIPLSGSALVADDATSGCEGGGHYAKIRDIRSGATWYDNLVALAIEGSDVITLAPSATKAVRTYGVFSNGSSRLIDPAKLTYEVTVGTATGLTIANATGILTAGSTQGEGSLSVTVANKPSVKVIATVTVAS